MKTRVWWMAPCVLVGRALGPPTLAEGSRCAVAQYGAAAKNGQMKAAVQRGCDHAAGTTQPGPCT